MDLSILFSGGIFLLAFLSLLGVVFNILLTPVKKDIRTLRESHKELKESHKELNTKIDQLLSRT